MISYDKRTITDLIDGKLEWPALKPIISNYKDPDRFEKVLEILQSRVSWKEKILLPLQEHLNIVQKGKERIVKCDCGYEFGDYRENWKYKAKVLLRDTDELMEELYRQHEHADPKWDQIREFYCPGCFALLDVEVLPPGYPAVFNFLPDLEGFYKDILKIPLPEA